MKTYIGIDNGVSGACAFVNDNESGMIPTPTFSQQNYTKLKGNISRLERSAFSLWLDKLIVLYGERNLQVVFERPMVNPGRFSASISAVRCLEAQLSIVEDKGLSFSYIDSKKWQKALLPLGLNGKELKVASADIGIRIFPQFKALIEKQKDADALLMAEYARRMKL